MMSKNDSSHDPFTDDGEYGSDPNFDPNQEEDSSDSAFSPPKSVSSQNKYGYLSPSSEEDLENTDVISDENEQEKMKTNKKKIG